VKGIIFKDELVLAIDDGRKTQTRRLEDKPRHKVGDRLYIKQAWRTWQQACDDNEEWHEEENTAFDYCDHTYVAYRANPRIGYRPIPDKVRICYLDESTPIESNKELLGPWKSSMLMPEWAARTFIEIIEVRVQRLQEISDADARAEGIAFGEMQDAMINGELGRVAIFDPRTAFAMLWNAINGARGESLSWRANPTVTAYTFKVVPR
jgi:hypothetical protein